MPAAVNVMRKVCVFVPTGMTKLMVGDGKTLAVLAPVNVYTAFALATKPNVVVCRVHRIGTLCVALVGHVSEASTPWVAYTLFALEAPHCSAPFPGQLFAAPAHVPAAAPTVGLVLPQKHCA